MVMSYIIHRLDIIYIIPFEDLDLSVLLQYRAAEAMGSGEYS